jgi:hypothetical protein
LEGLCNDVRDHELGGAVDQLNDFLDDEVVDPEVPDSDMSCKLRCRSPILHQFDGVLKDSDRSGPQNFQGLKNGVNLLIELILHNSYF